MYCRRAKERQSLKNPLRDVFTFKTFILWLHLTAVIVWFGGMVLVTLLLLPMLQCSTSSPRDYSRIIERTVKRFQTISWEAVGIILLTGVFNLINVVLGRGFNFSATYLHIVAIKLSLLVVVIAIQSFQSYSILPKLVSAQSSDDKLPTKSDSFDRLRKKTIWLSISNLALAGVVIYLGLGLKYQ